MAKVLALKPDERFPLIKKAQALFDADDIDGAARVAEEYLMKHPNDAQALVLMSAILRQADKPMLSYQLAKRATDVAPERSETWCEFGRMAQLLWKTEEAEQSYRKALTRAKNNKHRALYNNNIGSVLLDKGEFEKAEKWFRDSIDLDANEWRTKHNLALSLLAQRKWKEGWQFYSASIGTKSRFNWKYGNEPTWSGEKGKTVVITGEQGLGDEISFASMIPDAIRDCSKVIIDCDPRLKGLFSRSFPAKVYGTRRKKQLNWALEDQKFDASISMGELGQFYRNSTADFSGAPYLTPCPVRTEQWERTFREQKPVIGIAWNGGTWNTGAINRHLDLDELQPLFSAVNAHWVSLEYRDASKEIEGTPVVQYPWATLTQDYDDTAALVAACDLVICMQTAVAHLAGALGVPVWVMVPRNSQWRYGSDAEDSPWYKSMRVFKAKNEWAPVVQAIAKELKSVDFASL